ncbi:MAG: class I SAM-dependent methyltransferase [Hyphomicrobiaceae bacterium]
MDRETLRVYDEGAAGFAADWEDAQAAPDDLRAAVRTHFAPGPTVDVGCGSGRDTAWLVEAGFDAFGVDASPGLLAEARRRHPGVRFEQDALPALASLGSGRFTNVLCETVIMHLDRADIAPAVRRLAALLAPGGTLYLTWRVTEGGDARDKAGRLYASFDPTLVRDALAGMEIRLDERSVSASSGRIVHRMVARRRAQG